MDFSKSGLIFVSYLFNHLKTKIMAVKTVKKPAVDIKISEVLDLLDKGKTRPEIAKHFDLNLVQVAALFRHEKLRGKKTKKVASDAFNIVDDAPDAVILNIPGAKKESGGNNDEPVAHQSNGLEQSATAVNEPAQQSSW